MKELKLLLASTLFFASILITRAQCPTQSSVMKIETPSCTGTSAQIGVVTSAAGVTYQVKRDGVDFGAPKVSSSISTPFMIVTTTTSGTYTVVATKSGCSPVTQNGTAPFTNPGAAAPPSGGISLGGSPSICSGQSVSLNATTGYASYQWKKNGTNITGATSASYSASSAGTYTVLVTNTCNISTTWSTAPISVTPTVGAPSTPVGQGNFCQGSISTSTYTTSASNAASYTWSISPAEAGTIGTSSGTVNWSSSFYGDVIITVKANGCGGPSIGVTKRLTILQGTTMTSVMKSQGQCPGSTAQIGIVTSMAGVSYQVQKDGVNFGNPVNSTGISTPFWLANTTEEGVYTVLAYNPNCGSTIQMNGSATVAYDHTPPQGSVSLSDSPSLCIGETVKFTATPGFSSYQWFRNGAIINGAITNVYTAGTAGSYTVTVTNACGVSTTWLTPPVAVVPNVGKPSPPAGNKLLCQGTTTSSYTALADAAASYHWEISPTEAGTISSNGTVSWAAGFSGLATISVQADGCNGPSEPSTVTVEMVGNLGVPAAPMGLLETCQGGSSTYASTATNAQAYSWALSNAGSSKLTDNGYSTTSTSATVDWDPAFVGQAVLEVTAMTTGGCGTSTTKSSITIDVKKALGTLQIMTGPVNYCVGSSITPKYEALAENASRYTWTVSPSSAGTVNSSGTVNFNSSFRGTATINVTAYGCNQATQSTSAKVYVADPPACQENYNYVKTFVSNRESLTGSITDLTADDRSLTSEYFDGLGRLMQTVDAGATPGYADVVLPVTYDNLGRQAVTYLPYSIGNNGTFKSTFLPKENVNYGVPAVSEHFNFYQSGDKIATDTKPFAETFYEPSPLNRMIRQGQAGAAWQPSLSVSDHAVKKSYDLNEDYQVRQFLFDQQNDQIIDKGYYFSDRLFVTSTTDEDGNETVDFVDMNGRLVMKKVLYTESSGLSATADTYRLYDDRSNLIAVLPPNCVDKYTANPNDASWLNESYQYRFDGRNRMIKKKLPHADWTYMVYDDRDRLVMIQDGNQRGKDVPEWTIMKYDALNRCVLTGIYKDTEHRDWQSMQNKVTLYYNNLQSSQGWYDTYTSVGSLHGYDDKSFPQGISPQDYLTVSFYDDYGFKASQTNQQAFDADPAQVGNVSILSSPENYLTGSKTRILGEDKWLLAINYYDDNYNLVQVVKQDHLGGINRVNNQYNFRRQLKQTEFVHSLSGQQRSTLQRFDYDQVGRRTKGWYQVDQSPLTEVFENEYNDLGQLVMRKLHKSQDDFAQHIDYRYNIRGWLQRINSADLSPESQGEPLDFFGAEYSYNEQNGTNNTGRYNGNISSVKWSGSGAGKQHAYTYRYDPFNRLVEGKYKSSADGSAWDVDAGKFDMSLGYDVAGNITSLTRSAGADVVLDDLQYRYEGNQLKSVDDRGDRINGFTDGNIGSDDFRYDANGNLTTDLNKGVASTQYNYLNLVDAVSDLEGAKTRFVFDADGNKIGQRVYDKNGELKESADYIGPFAYVDGAIQSASHQDGQVVLTDGSPEYQYNISDNVGNTRIVFTTKPDIEIMTATFEDDRIEEETSVFKNYSRTTNPLFDHTDAGNQYNKSQQLRGVQQNSIVGLSKSVAVIAGDKIQVEVYGKYFDPSISNPAPFVNLASALISAFGISPAVGGKPDALSSINAFFAQGPAILAAGLYPWEDEEAPKAYVNVLLFDKNYNVVDFAYDQIDASAEQPFGESVSQAFDKMAVEVDVHQDGYAFIFVSNENPDPVDVYFDDFKITYEHSSIIQRDDYYPFDLSISETAVKKGDLFYQGSSYSNFFGYKDLGFRKYDPATGRFFNLDPLAEFQFGDSPYQYAKNNPVRYADALGLASEEQAFEEQQGYAGRNNPGPGTGGRRKVFFLKIKNWILDLFSRKRRTGGLYNRGVTEGSGSGNGARTPNGTKKGTNNNASTTSNDVREFEIMLRNPVQSDEPAEPQADPPTNDQSKATDPPSDEQDLSLDPQLDQNSPNDPLVKVLDELYDKKDLPANPSTVNNEVTRQAGPQTAIILEKKNADAPVSTAGDPAKVSQDQSGTGNKYNRPEEILALIEKIRGSNEDGTTSIDVTSDLMAIDQDSSYPVNLVETYTANIDIGGKSTPVQVYSNVSRLNNANDRLIINPKGVRHKNTQFNKVAKIPYAFGRFGSFIQFDFKDPSDDKVVIQITVPADDSYSVEKYLGLAGETDELLSEILPGDASPETRQKYQDLLNQAHTDDGLRSNVTEEHWVTDQIYVYNGQSYQGHQKVKNAKGELVKAKEVGTRPLQCWDATAKMHVNAGFQSGTSAAAFQVSMEHKTEDRLIYDAEAMKKALKAIMDHLDEHRPIQVGVNYHWKGGINKDRSTDHWITIVAMKFDESTSQYYFEYFDPGTNFISTGVNPETNRLYLEKRDDSYILIGNRVPGDTSGKYERYEVTCVRPNADADTTDTINQGTLKDGNCETIKCQD